MLKTVAEPAFPCGHERKGRTSQGSDFFTIDYTTPKNQGMSLRDYFVVKAMQGLLAQSCGTAGGSHVEDGAYYAYKMADAMLAERKKGQS